MRIFSVPRIVEKITPGMTWSIPEKENVIYLTFDDGPTREVTPYLLSLLWDYNIKATFFCVGENVFRNPDLTEKILAAGHSIGNHTYNHLNGWNTPTNEYVNNVLKCNPLINSKLFRPPYGKIRPSQSQILRDKGYTIIMWTLLSYDFDNRLSSEVIRKRCIAQAKAGSVIVFHDNVKSVDNLKGSLPFFIERMLKQNYTFSAIS